MLMSALLFDSDVWASVAQKCAHTRTARQLQRPDVFAAQLEVCLPPVSLRERNLRASSKLLSSHVSVTEQHRLSADTCVITFVITCFITACLPERQLLH